MDATLARRAGLPRLASARVATGEVTVFFSGCPSLVVVREAEVLFWSCWMRGLLEAAGFLLAAVSLPADAASSGLSFFYTKGQDIVHTHRLRRTCMERATTRSPCSLTIIDLGGLSSARRSCPSTLPFSVPTYSVAPSAENARHVMETCTLHALYMLSRRVRNVPCERFLNPRTSCLSPSPGLRGRWYRRCTQPRRVSC